MKTILTRLAAFALCALLLAAPMAPMAAEGDALTEEEYKQIEGSLSDDSKEIPVTEEFRFKVDPDDLSIAEGLNEDWVNILLLGTDAIGGPLNYGRTDTMIILSVNKVTGKMRLASLVRDMYVKLPLVGWENRINTANTFGGPLLAVKTVNELFGLNIRNYVSINFSGFRRVIDSLGGVFLKLKPTECQLVKIPYKEEGQVLNGEQALAYVRIRALDDNFGRNDRQRKLLTSLFNKMLNESTMQQAMGALTESLRHMATNLSINDLLTLVVPVFGGMETMDTAGFPAEGDYKGQMLENGMSVVLFDQEATTRKLHAYLFEGVMP